jgi:hypothetical protein
MTKKKNTKDSIKTAKKPKSRDLKTTIAGSVFTAAVAAAPFFPQYAAYAAAAQVVSGALMAFYAKDRK